MATYNYICLTCKAEAEQIKGSSLESSEEWEVMFETSHRMTPTDDELKEATRCPRCQNNNSERTLLGVCPALFYVRGNGYLDKKGCHRDMNLFKLEKEDPYDEMREPGEVDDLKSRLKKSGQHAPNAKYFINQAREGSDSGV